MIPETILIFACLYGKGCPETVQAYGFYNKSLVNEMNITMEEVKKNYPSLVKYASPALGFYIKGEGSIYLRQGLSLDLKDRGYTCILSYRGDF